MGSIKILLGFVLGFVGYLPLGNINLTVVQLALDEAHRRVWLYIMFVAFMEFVYCVGCIMGMNALLQNPHWVVRLQWSSVVLFLLLGVLSFVHDESDGKKPAFSGIKRGVFIAVFNPLQIPFWIVWGVYVMENNWVQNSVLSIVLFGIITAIGTIAILWIYAVTGKRLIEKLNVERHLINWLIGSIFILLSIWQLYKVLYHH